METSIIMIMSIIIIDTKPQRGKPLKNDVHQITDLQSHT